MIIIFYKQDSESLARQLFASKSYSKFLVLCKKIMPSVEQDES